MIKHLPELIKAEVISQETADKISLHYDTTKGTHHHRLHKIFGVLGVISIGLGIILILAQNWDAFSISLKTSLAFFPLLFSQTLCGYVLLKKQDHKIWREIVSTFLFFSIGTCISLISLIYNISVNMSMLLFIWMFLSFPLIYLMRSSITSLLYIIGITYYAVETGYWTFQGEVPYAYWLLFALVLPHYYLLYKNKPESHFLNLHHWLTPISVVISLGTITQNLPELMYLSYFGLFGLLHILGRTPYFIKQKILHRSFEILGSLGTVILLLWLSFNNVWNEVYKKQTDIQSILESPELIASITITLLALVALFVRNKTYKSELFSPIEYIFMAYIPTLILGIFSPIISIIFINLFVFILGIATIVRGTHAKNLISLNFGLLIITSLILCRFFDAHVSFIIRGIVFILVGIGFIATNYWLLKKQKNGKYTIE